MLKDYAIHVKIRKIDGVLYTIYWRTSKYHEDKIVEVSRSKAKILGVVPFGED